MLQITVHHLVSRYVILILKIMLHIILSADLFGEYLKNEH